MRENLKNQLASLCFALSILLLLIQPPLTAGEEIPGAEGIPVAKQEREIDKQHLLKIYDALKAYRQDQGRFPDWLADLFPKYLSDADLLISPVEKRTGESRLFGYADPKMKSSYVYEFSAAESGRQEGGRNLPMKEWKARQMETFGPAIPILRCHLHDPVLNVAYAGVLYETAMMWESDPQTLKLMERLGSGKGPTDQAQLQVLVVESSSGQPLEEVEIQSLNASSSLGALPSRKARTGAEGKAVLPLGAKVVQSLTVRASKAGYSPAQAALEGGSLPAGITLKLEKATQIGGVVRSTNGPIAGVKISINGIAKDVAGQSVEVEHDAVASDNEGKWSSALVPAEFKMLTLHLRHPEYLPADYDLTDPPGTDAYALAKSALLAAKADLLMEPGIVIEGDVRDEQNQPVAGARMILASGEQLAKRTLRTTTPEGKFRFVVLELGTMQLAAQAPGKAPAHQSVEVERGLKPLAIQLKKGVQIQGQVIDAEGQPMPAAEVSAQGSESHPLLSWRATTDAGGRFAWDSAPREPFSLIVSKAGYTAFSMQVAPESAGDLKVKLDRSFKLAGTVLDDATAKPVKAFKLIQGMVWTRDDPNQVYWQFQNPPTFSNGEYSVDLSQQGSQWIKFMITADGYLPQETPVLPASGWHTNNFKLKAGHGPQGRVVLEDGSAVEGAEVAMAGIGYLTLSKGAFSQYGNDTLRTKTDAQGHFSLTAMLANPTLIAVSAKGYGEITTSELAKTGRLVIQPWGRIDGVLRLGSKPGSKQSVSLMPGDTGRPSVNYDWGSFKVQTDDQGRFVFEKVPPGKRTLVRMIQTSANSWLHSHTEDIEVKAGETTKIVYGGKGRPVIGKVVLSDPKRKIDWHSGNHSLNSRMPLQSMLGQAISALAPRLASGRPAAENRRFYGFTVEEGGTFRVENVLPGKYDLQMNFTEPAKDNPGNGEPIGNLHQEFTIPEIPGGQTDEPLDLGELKLFLKATLEIGDPAPEFEVKSLDGQMLKLEDFKGKCLLLYFEFMGPAGAVQDMAILKNLSEKYGKNKLAILSLVQHDPSVKLGELVKLNGLDWVHVSLGMWGQSPLPTIYGINNWPSGCLVGPDGKVRAKNLRGAALAATVEAALKESGPGQ